LQTTVTKGSHEHVLRASKNWNEDGVLGSGGVAGWLVRKLIFNEYLRDRSQMTSVLLEISHGTNTSLNPQLHKFYKS